MTARKTSKTALIIALKLDEAVKTAGPTLAAAMGATAATGVLQVATAVGAATVEMQITRTGVAAATEATRAEAAPEEEMGAKEVMEPINLAEEPLVDEAATAVTVQEPATAETAAMVVTASVMAPVEVMVATAAGEALTAVTVAMGATAAIAQELIATQETGERDLTADTAAIVVDQTVMQETADTANSAVATAAIVQVKTVSRAMVAIVSDPGVSQGAEVAN